MIAFIGSLEDDACTPKAFQARCMNTYIHTSMHACIHTYIYMCVCVILKKKYIYIYIYRCVLTKRIEAVKFYTIGLSVFRQYNSIK